MATIPEVLAEALRHHRAGALPQAEQLYRQVLQTDPNNAEAWNLLGVVAYQAGRADVAIEYMQRAVSLRPDEASFQSNLGLVCQALDRRAEAYAHFQEALRLKPDFADARYNLGLWLAREGRWAEAEGTYHEALRLSPASPEIHNDLGNALRRLGRPDEAIACYRQALHLRPEYVGAYNNLGIVLTERGRLEEAIASCQAGLVLAPQNVELHFSFGNTLMAKRQAPEAAAHFREAIRLRPTFAEAMLALGIAVQQQGKLDEAIACFEEGLRLKPDSPEGFTALGLALFDLGRLDEALDRYAQALRLRPDFADAHADQSLVYLIRGDFERGWPEYEWRWRITGAGPRPLPQPVWDGSPLAGRTILLHHEQGIGDTIQFIRYAPLLKARGATVIMECPAGLIPLLSRCPGIDRWVPLGSPAPAFDVHAPLLSLPWLFGTTLDTVPAEVPYVFPEPQLHERWKRDLATEHIFKVGISWQGNPAHRVDRWRSAPLACFEPLARVPGVRLYSIQKGHGSEQLAALQGRFPVVDLAGRLDRDTGVFMDTAAVMTNLDLIVSCDTAVPHLAGALGVPIWMALGFMPDWRWLLDRDDSPWYPTMRLFRQQKHGDWAPLFERIAQELSRLVAEKQAQTGRD